MKKTTLFSLLTLVMLLCGGHAWAADKLYYTLKVAKNGANTAYDKTFDVTVDELQWNVPGNQGLDGGIVRIGGKGLDGVDRVITGKSAIASAIDRVVFNHNGTSNSALTVNSMTLTVASDATFETVIDNVVLTPAITQGSADAVTFVPSTGTEWPTAAFYKVTINVSNSNASKNYGLDMTSIEFFKPLASTGVSDPVIKLAPGTYVGDQFVDIEGGEDCAAMDVKVYTNYPDEFSYTHMLGNKGRILIHENCTVGVIAIGAPDPDSSLPPVTSNEVLAKYVILQPLGTIAEVCAAATTTESSALLDIKDWTVTGVKGSNVYFTDGTNGVQLYQSGHNFEVGDVLNGQVQAKLLIYNDCAELKGLTKTTEGLTVTKGEGAKPMEVVVADLGLDCQGNLISLKNVTYNAASNVFIDDDDNEIIAYGNFITLPTLADGKQYNVTGVAIWFKSKGKWEIAPRTVDEIELLTSQIVPESAWSLTEETVDVNAASTAKFTTNSDGAVTYKSSNEAVATIDAEGKITLVGKGKTVISATTAETETYLTDTKSFTLNVTKEGYYDVTYSYKDEDIKGQGMKDAKGEGFGPVVRGAISLTTTNAYGNDSYLQIYGTNKTDGNSVISLQAAPGNIITDVVITTTTSYTRTWLDQYGTEAAIDGTVVTWQGESEHVILINQSTSQARVTKIEVSYTTDNATGIQHQTLTDTDATIYDLSGRKVSKAQKGIYIIGGKRILFQN